MNTHTPKIVPESTISVTNTADQISFRHLVRSGHEWMEVTCSAYQKGEAKPCVAMGLTITSSYGAFGFNYPNIVIGAVEDPAIAAMQFLAGVNETSLLNKIVEDKVEVFDWDRTKTAIEEDRDELLKQACTDADKAEINDAWDDVMEAMEFEDSQSPDIQADRLTDAEGFTFLCGDDAWERMRTKPGRRYEEARGMFTTLWIPYQDTLRNMVKCADHR